MKRSIISFFIFAIFISFSVPSLWALDKVVAIVSNEIITQKDLDDFSNFMRMQYSRQFKGKVLEEKIGTMKQDLLQRLIEDKLILDQAKNEKIIIDPDKIKSKINEIKKRYPTESEFERDLAKQGLVQADLENKIREQMLMYSIVEQKVRSKVVVWPDEITSFFNQNKKDFLKPEERILLVIISLDEDTAKTLSYQLRLGTKIEELAGRYSFTTDKLSALKGQELRSEIEDTVFKLGVKEVSDPVRIDQKFYIFKLDDIVVGQQLSLGQAQDKIQSYLFEKKMQEEMVKWLDELKKQSYIKILEN
ncbi:MAG: SurA N-terminal domain-containing protein [Candidatus Omnitrophica bacterium]|nr:SurA N-terminal domain-containing protein [Candidatus Omnitrophota bacterium]